MADRYWVGGTGTWNTTTTNWAATSGGASGASVPTAADNVFFDSASNATGYTCTFTTGSCLSISIIGPATGTVTISGSTNTLNISGSFFVASTGVTLSGTIWNFVATTAGNTITSNSKMLNEVRFNGTGTWTLNDAISTGAFQRTRISSGTLNTNGFNFTAQIVELLGATASLICGASTFTASGFSAVAGATLNAGSSQMNLTSFSVDVVGGLTFNNVTFTTAATIGTINGVNTFTNLTVSGKTGTGVSELTLGGNQTITGTLALNSGASAVNRTMILSSATGTQRTLTCAVITGGTDYDFRDIVIAGAASPISPTRAGDCKGNSGITFPAAKTVYYRSTGSANWSASWSATSGGASDATMFPLAQDTAVFPAATYPASGLTTTMNAQWNIGTIDMSLRTSNTMTLATSTNNVKIYGNWIGGTGITNTTSTNGGATFSGRTTQQITNAGNSFARTIIIDTPTGSVTLQDPLTATIIGLSRGTLDLNNLTLTATTSFSTSTLDTKVLAFGTGNITCSGTGTVWSTTSNTGLTVTGSKVVNVTSTGATAITVSPGSLLEANTFNYNFTGGTYALSLLTSASSSVGSLDFTGYAGTLGSTGTSVKIYGNFKLSTGMTLTSGTNAYTFAGTSGTQQITTNGKTLDLPLTFDGVGGTFQLQDALTMGSTRLATLTNGTLDLQSYTLSAGTFSSSNLNTRTIAFGTGKIDLTGTGTVWTTGTFAGLTTTGTQVVNVTSVGAVAIIVTSGGLSEANSISFNFTGGTYGLSFLNFSGYTARNVNFTGYAGTLAATSSATIYGNLTLSTGMTLTASTLALTFGATSGTKTITSNTKTMNFPITFNGVGGTFQLQDALTMGSTRTATLTNGTLDLNNLTLSTGLFSSNNSNVRTLAFGTGKIDLTGTGTAWDALTATNFSTSGSKTVNFTSVGSTTITCNSGLSEANAVDFNVIGGTYQFRFGYTSGISSVRNLNFTGFSGTWSGLLGDAYIYGNLIMSATMLVGAGGSKFFAATSGTKTITSNGVSLNLVEFDGVGGTWQLQDAMGVTQATGTQFVNGTVDLNGNTLTTSSSKTEAGTKNITFNGGTLAITDASSIAWYNINPTGFTTTAGTGTGTISMTAATAKSFQGGGSTYNCTLNQGGAGDLTITGSNTFLDITNTTQPATVLFTGGATNTFLSGFSLSGTAGNLITIGSTTTTNFTLSKASGTVSVSFCSISRSSATGGATWEALTTNGNVNGGNNTGWDFGGVIYAAVIAETVTATDAILSLAIFRSALSETATATDSPSVAASTFNAPVSETATATDSILGRAVFRSALSETATATDSILGRAAFSSALSETATATDSPSVAASTFNAPVAETATATDSPSVVASTFNAPVSETATATDSILGQASFSSALAETATATDSPSVAASTFNAPVAETATATDSVLSLADFYAALAETTTATDSVISFADFYAALAEAATATDSILGLSDLFVSLEETATATDSPLVAPSTFNAPVAETATATDAVSPPGSIYNAPVSETVTISDLVLALFLWNLIDDSQSVTWQNINSSPGTTWSPIDTDPDTGWSVTPTVN